MMHDVSQDLANLSLNVKSRGPGRHKLRWSSHGLPLLVTVLISRLLLFAITYKIVPFLQWHYVKGDVCKVMNTYIVLRRKYGCTRRTSTNQ